MIFVNLYFAEIWKFPWKGALHDNTWAWGTPIRFAYALYVPLFGVCNATVIVYMVTGHLPHIGHPLEFGGAGRGQLKPHFGSTRHMDSQLMTWLSGARWSDEYWIVIKCTLLHDWPMTSWWSASYPPTFSLIYMLNEDKICEELTSVECWETHGWLTCGTLVTPLSPKGAWWLVHQAPREGMT